MLHFAAKYGLKNLTALLLTCPGALQAYSVANKHGHYPNTIAEKHGFRDLRQFIDEYVVRSNRKAAGLGLHHVVPGPPKTGTEFTCTLFSVPLPTWAVFQIQSRALHAHRPECKFLYQLVAR